VNFRDMAAGIVINRAMTAREWLLLIALAILWGATYPFVAIAVREIPPLTLTFLRVALAAVTLHVVIRAMGIALPTDRASWTIFAGQALLNNVIPFSLINWGQQHIPSGIASVLIASTPFFTVIAAHYFTNDEKMTPGRILGVLLGMAGVATIIGPAALGKFGVDVLGELAVVGAAVSYTVAGLYGRRAGARGLAPLATATGMLTVSTLIMLPLALTVDQPWALPWPSVPAWLCVIGIALPGTALAYIIFFRVLASAGSTNIMLVTFLLPVTAVLLGVTWLGERLEPRHFAGMALVALGLAAIDGRIWQRLRRGTSQAAAK
jgi:drug/metabolite transporter (DMT)-like permease